ncbi:hypothetical protein HGO38_01325 [Rhizobium sp. CG5]|uniref:hypothetical protein n=1 Tax=Rhizobium sp. CG5 TaxID=2726076 RepID=UPI00203415DE|nr:hypothetical protein [Rhizobium sp. CG5]MCM2472116.1 hypothetical protein [Rhizobium sp. CG5]
MSETDAKIPDRIYVQFGKSEATWPAISLRMWSLEPFKGATTYVIEPEIYTTFDGEPLPDATPAEPQP